MCRDAYLNWKSKEDVPDFISKIADTNKFEHLIWIPHDISHGDKYKFTIRYAHEFQHYCQFFDSKSKREAQNYLKNRRNKGIGQKPRFETDHAELDAERAAIKIFKELHGIDAFNLFVNKESCDPNMKEKYERLLLMVNDLESFNKN